jgi:hypothetical protein
LSSYRSTTPPEISAPIVVHDNVRGGDYFDLNEDSDKS